MDHQFCEFAETLITDELWTPQAYEIIKREIESGNTLVGAASEAGISKRKIENWMKNDSFSDIIHSIEAKHIGAIYKNIESNIDAIEDPKNAADTMIKFLERRDSKFGTKNVDISDNREKETVDPVGRKRVQNVLDNTLIVEEQNADN